MTNHQQSNRPTTQHRPINSLHPSNGNGTPYSQDIRQLTLRIAQEGIFNPQVRDMVQLQHEGVLPHRSTISRWNSIRDRLGHLRACKRTGNARARVLRGPDLILLAIYRITYPKAKASEINAFLHNCNYGNVHFRLYSASQISRAEKMIGLTMIL